MRGYMKKILLFASFLVFLGSPNTQLTASEAVSAAAAVVPAIASATPVTQAFGAATVAVLTGGAIVRAIGSLGCANTIGVLAAGGLGYVAHFATDAALQGSTWLPVFMAANPMVAPLIVGAGVAGLMLWLRTNYLPGPSKQVAELGNVLLKLGVGMAGLSAILYAINVSPYEISILPKKSA
jgi:hypothetical protein